MTPPQRGADTTPRPWHDTTLSTEARVDKLLSAMTLEEKLAQLGSVWLGAEIHGNETNGTGDEPSGNVAPMQDVFARQVDFDAVTRHGLGHLTRPFGTRPVDPLAGSRALEETQRKLVSRSRFGIPALAHEECLTGFTAYRASVFPAPIAMAAAFAPDLVERIAHAIGTGMRAVGIHQGLSPVLDVVRDYRWGRVEETLGEDPYLVAMSGTAYVKGLEQAGIIATVKHFAGYSASRAARNHAPVSMGRRELADIILPPFEMAVREGGARSVMNSYADIDGVPAGADPWLLTTVLRDEWGFTGTVVSDYWSVAFLAATHGIADSYATAGAAALRAGVDVELPDTLCFGPELAAMVRDGRIPEDLVDRAARRVLRQKTELGMLDADWTPVSDAVRAGGIDLDPPANRQIARDLAERSIVLLDNPGSLLPLPALVASIAVIGPNADDSWVHVTLVGSAEAWAGHGDGPGG
ncbi:glycoside hydrolase family 3 protein [Streptomyces sp. So13.3]|nr:glycoside hydrolase family 3 protein [Streptomyces sp. So13.3]